MADDIGRLNEVEDVSFNVKPSVMPLPLKRQLAETQQFPAYLHLQNLLRAIDLASSVLDSTAAGDGEAATAACAQFLEAVQVRKGRLR